jgi:ClpP class serine protease
MSLLGFPLFRYIDIQDSEEILRAIKLTAPEVPVDLIVHTPGGLVLAASQIAHALRKHPGKVTVFVPHYAMSGGTLIALAADEIVMDDNAVLGPVDPQLGQDPAASILRVLEQKSKDEIEDATLIHADMAEKALRQVRQCVTWILEERMGRDRAAALAETLSQGTWTHDHPITFEEAKEMGLSVSSAMPDEIYEFMTLFPQPARQRPSVEYIPLPYGTRPGGRPRGS